MKCPKCHYLSFDPEPRCRNCGYTLALGDADLVMKPAEPALAGPMADLALRVAAAPPSGDFPSRVRRDEIESRLKGSDAPAATLKRRRRAAARGPFDAPDTAAG